MDQKQRLRKLIIFTLLLFSLGLLAWHLYPSITGSADRHRPAQKPASVERIDLQAYIPWQDKSPTVLAAAPQDMYNAFARQYSWRPDTRFFKAFELLAEHYGEVHSAPHGQGRFRMGEAISNGKEILLPLLEEDRILAEIRVPLPMTFAGAMSGLNEWLAAMEGQKPRPQGDRLPESGGERWEEAVADIHGVDPRNILTGLIKLEALRRRVGPEAHILKAAVRGYAVLHLVLFPDRMGYADGLAAHAIGCLALARRMAPELDIASEEALLAITMGYTAHATALLKSRSPADADPVEQMFQAYILQDLDRLKTLRRQVPGVLGPYLVARLYRNMKLDREAQSATAHLLETYPWMYPVIVESIYSADLGTAKHLTIAYPLAILANLESQIVATPIDDKRSWQERIKVFAGERSAGNISLSRFEELLGRWRPLGPGGGSGLLVDEKRVKTVFRTLYSGALFLRFHLLLNRWAVVERAENFAKLLADHDAEHPLVLEMLAAVDAELGNREQADAICSKLIALPKAPSKPATEALFIVDDHLTKTKLTAAAAHLMDGRPQNLFSMGAIFHRLLYYDLAERYYSAGLSRDPHRYRIYRYLAQVTGSDEPLSAALLKFPYSFTLMEEAGDYYADKNDLPAKGKALECYALALKLVPTRKPLAGKMAKVLRRLDRRDEAVRVLKAWIDEYGGDDLTTATYKAGLARTYLEMGKPRMAWEVIGDQIASYQAEVMMVGARSLEDFGELDRAGRIYRKAVSRYPTVDHVLSGTAAFCWRHHKNEEAAELIAQGRKSMRKFSQWYFDDFVEVFGDAPAERILEAVDRLIKKGAALHEISSLAFRFQKNRRSEVAFRILQKSNAQKTMQRLEQIVSIYKVLREWRGDEHALAYLRSTVPPHMKEPLVMVLFSGGVFDVILAELDDPGTYSERHAQFLWLQRLIVWLALGKNPPGLEKEIVAHYDRNWFGTLVSGLGKKNPYGYYHDIGRYLLGMISEEQLLGLIKTPKQRCEFAYYIGLSKRLDADFPAAAAWYQICQETLLQNNGEYHWAFNELFWWAHTGTRNRHRLPGDDIKAYHLKAGLDAVKEAVTGAVLSSTADPGARIRG